ncbi:MAG: hypothetical protein HZB16_03600 [Armatimonadetes bacterium]|nr:hypothetical protein [Armatimonadota bacterium]
MVDWDTLLQPAALGLANSVASIATTERLDLSNVPYVEATVVLPAGITDDRLNWDLVAPIHAKVWDCIAAHIEAGYPHVTFITLEDYQAAQRGDFYDEAAEGRDAAA